MQYLQKSSQLRKLMKMKRACSKKTDFRGYPVTDFEKALLDPNSFFKTPGEILKRNDFSREQKMEILRRWEYDVRELQVAEEESLPGPQLVTLDSVLNALRALGAPANTDRSASTKQGGR